MGLRRYLWYLSRNILVTMGNKVSDSPKQQSLDACGRITIFFLFFISRAILIILHDNLMSRLCAFYLNFRLIKESETRQARIGCQNAGGELRCIRCISKVKKKQYSPTSWCKIDSCAKYDRTVTRRFLAKFFAYQQHVGIEKWLFLLLGHRASNTWNKRVTDSPVG